MLDFTLNTGQKLVINDICGASIPAKFKEEAFEWLRQNNAEELIKHDVKMQFGKGEQKMAAKAIELLIEAGYQPSDKETVHAGTLSAWVREQLDRGVDIPKKLFGVFEGKKAIIKD